MPHSSKSRLARAFAAIDTVNSADPRTVPFDGGMVGVEWLYGRRMSQRLAAFADDASDELQIAVRAQHIGRWKIARTEYPEGRTGYKQWRSRLGRMHADMAADIAREAGCDADRVAAIVQKRGLQTDSDAQTLEDVACLVFLEHYFADFAAKHPRDKLVSIVRKTWAKMSQAGQAAARGLPLADSEAAIVRDALADS